MSAKKYWYKVGTGAEGFSSGYIELTKAEAALVKKVTTKTNWTHYEDEGWSGHFSISTLTPMTKEEMEINYKRNNSWDDEEDEENSSSYANYYEYADEDAERDGLLEYGLL